MTKTMSDYYALLEVRRNATGDQIKQAYRRLALRWHPDKARADADRAAARFRAIRQAYGVLSDDDKRRRYDARWEPVAPSGRPRPSLLARLYAKCRVGLEICRLLLARPPADARVTFSLDARKATFESTTTRQVGGETLTRYVLLDLDRFSVTVLDYENGTVKSKRVDGVPQNVVEPDVPMSICEA